MGAVYWRLGRRKKLKLPYYPTAADDRAHEQYDTATYWKHVVAGYTGLNFQEIDRLNYVTFLQYRRDAFIQRCRSTAAGQEYLDNAWRMEQVEPDRDALRKKLSRGGRASGEEHH